MFTLQKGPRDAKFNSRNLARWWDRDSSQEERAPHPRAGSAPRVRRAHDEAANRCSARPRAGHARILLMPSTGVRAWYLSPSLDFLPSLSWQHYSFTVTSCVPFTSVMLTAGPESGVSRRLWCLDLGSHHLTLHLDSKLNESSPSYFFQGDFNSHLFPFSLTLHFLRNPGWRYKPITDSPLLVISFHLSVLVFTRVLFARSQNYISGEWLVAEIYKECLTHKKHHPIKNESKI